MTQVTIQQAFEMALRHHQAGRLYDAEHIYRQILAHDPLHIDAMHNLAVIEHQAGRDDIAIQLLRQTVVLNPNHAEAHNNLGNALRDQGRFDEAIAAFRRALSLRPDLSDARSNLANAFTDNGQLDEAITASRQAIALSPDSADAHNSLGNALQAKGQHQEAIAAYRNAIALRPDDADAHNNLATALRGELQFDEATAVYRQAIALNFNDAHTHYNLALTLLMLGELREGWQEYEWRWRCKDFPAVPRDFAQPLWDGSPLADRCLLIHCEQGFGDTLQFIRYLPLLIRFGGKVIVECQPELHTLLKNALFDYRIVARGQALPAFDVHCPLLSLPRIVGATLDSIPRDVPYLHALAGDVRYWRQRLASLPPATNVGLCWAGSLGNTNDRSRSIPLSALGPLGSIPGVRFFSLQHGPGSDQAHSPPAGMPFFDWSAELPNFADAALVANLDLVITVDTATAHLAGALGRPVWLLLSSVHDWRWLLDRWDSPWYPSMRLFRQRSKGDWRGVIRDIAEALAAFFPGSGSPDRST